MNNETLNRLNAFIADYKKESEEKDAIIKQQNQTLLHISAELDATKQYDPFDMVMINGFIENISNVIKGETDPIFDEGCIGCAGPCNVVDVAANLQEELDSVMVRLVDSRNRCGYLSSTIEELKDKNIEDLHELYDLYEEELRGLKAELSARKEDSAVLMKVVDEVRYRKSVEPHLNRTTEAKNAIVLNRLFELLDDYLNAPKGPPETPIDDLYKVTVSYAFLEMP